MNAMAPTVLRVIVDDDNNKIEVVIPDGLFLKPLDVVGKMFALYLSY